MNLEKDRLEDLASYKIMDSTPETELDELTELASLICNTPISLITLLNEDRHWFKAKKGLDVSETPRKDSFCQHTLHIPKEILIVNDSLKDVRFKNSPLVTGPPYIRFYAGAPLETPNGNILGTLCVIDNKPRTISINEKKALQILSKKVMDYLNDRKIIMNHDAQIESSARKLKKLTDNIPGGIFQLKMNPDGELKFEFLSKGIQRLHPTTDLSEWAKDPKVGYSLIHPEDLPAFKESLALSYKNLSKWNFEYRVATAEGYHWHLVHAEPEILEDGSVTWYGCFQDITSHVEYAKTMEQIAYDISHVLRNPVTNLLGLTSLISKEKELNDNSIKEYSEHITTIATNLDKFTRDLNDIYQMKKEKIAFHSNGLKT